MQTIEIDEKGHKLDLTFSEFLQYILANAKNILILSESYVSYHSSGLADIDHKIHDLLSMHIVARIIKILPLIEDHQLCQEINSLLHCLDKLEDLDNQIIRTYAEYFRLIDKDGHFNNKKVLKKVHESRIKNVIIPSEINPLINISQNLYLEIQMIYKSIEDRVTKLSI
ncbi:MAG: hypothetical protein GYA34_11020 [Chloroflexi bacterium]|nr:hypothetical protein [Chloroflexota bacterium]